MDSIPYGHCYCGCGNQTDTFTRSYPKRGITKGDPRFYLHGHKGRLSPIDYIEEDRGHTSPCWIWQRRIDKGGYGQAHCAIRKTTIPAHIWMYEKKHGQKSYPVGYDLDHLCRVRACVNPDHLEPVSRRENNLRSTNPSLSDSLIIQVYLAEGSCREIARKFGVGVTSVSEIKNRKYLFAENILPDVPPGKSTYTSSNSQRSAEEVREIREASGTHAEIGKRYGLSASMVGQIKRRQVWKHIL